MNIEHLIDEEVKEIDFRMTQKFSDFVHRNLAKMHKAIDEKNFEKAKSLKEYTLKMIDMFENTIKER